jgi:hypothetical protein
MRSALRTLSLGLLAFTAAACEDGLSFCTHRDDAGQCPELPDPVFDASIDANTPPSDAAADARTADATTADANVSMDAATTDAGTDAAAPTSYNVEEFCDAKYRVAKAWRDQLDSCCPSNATLEDRGIFLAGGLLYEDGNGDATESVDECVTRLNAAIGPNLTFSGTAAVACAAQYASQFAEAPTSCPAGGFEIDIREASIGKQAQELTQLSGCRSALTGKLAFNAACTDNYQCQAGLRCLNSVCRDALPSGNVCGKTEQCADGLVCIGGNTVGGRVCRPKAEPAALTAACTYSVECDPGAFCFDFKCTAPTNRAICAQ